MISEGFPEEITSVGRWLHLQDDKKVQLTIIAKNFVHFQGHYSERKMRICSESDCVFCDAGIGRQRRFVFDVVNIQTGEQLLYECSESVANQIRDIIDCNSYGERIFFEVYRLSPSKHSNCKINRILSKTDINFGMYEKQNLKEILLRQEEGFKRVRKTRDNYLPDFAKLKAGRQ